MDSNADAIAEEIMTNGPVEAAFTVYSDFENYVSGIYHATSQESVGGHAIKLVGWGVENGVKYWKAGQSADPLTLSCFLLLEARCRTAGTRSGERRAPSLALESGNVGPEYLY